MARDRFHYAVRVALEKEGWEITADPLTLIVKGVKFDIDLGADQNDALLGAVRGKDKTAVEVKSFIGSSAIYEFHGALGQFINYRSALRSSEPDRLLYLAVPVEAFDSLFQIEFVAEAVEENHLLLLNL